MPETLVWCTCSICLLNDDGGSWKLKSARVRHRNCDKRNALSSNKTFEHELYNIEYVSEFDNELRNNDRLKSTNKFENWLGKNNEFERFESIDESEYELENNIEFGYKLGNSDENEWENNINFEDCLEIDKEFENWSESESSRSNDSCITNMTFADYEGPCCMIWQYLIECVCRMLLPLIKSKLHPYKNLSNNIQLNEIFNCLKFNQVIYNQIFFLSPSKIYNEHLAYTEESDQDFYFPSTNYKLSQSELRKIKQHFSTISDVSGLQLISFSFEGTKYGWLRTKDVDIYANYRNRLSVFKIQDFYAVVEYYLLYEFEESKAMLAYIQWTSHIEDDDIGVKMFK
ncbi:871_t:CDS:2 [Cetraspora pellucida]|uniref:871_t:CDS:1 n=1 Tax=Cetraspora pellucida TaxID=1433469 RepID=A0A9N9G0J6_9GLOM|nr:871_t:CDS:2 [Cetraspora pellucida]